MRGAARSGRREPEIVTLFTVRFTKVSEITFPWTVRSLVMRADPDTVSRADGDDVPIPIFPVESVVLVPSILVPNMRFPILSVFELVGVGTSISYPRTILFAPVVRASPA